MTGAIDVPAPRRLLASLGADIRIRSRRRCAALLAALMAGGCTPTFDWREQLAPGTGLVTSFPCRPDRRARAVMVAGRPVTMEMLACPAGGETYAVSFFDVASPAQTSGALAALRTALIDNLQSGVADRTAPQAIGLAIVGMTPNPEAGQWLVRGRRPDGTTLVARGAFFAHGLRIYQAAVVGPTMANDAVDPFFVGLKFPG